MDEEVGVVIEFLEDGGLVMFFKRDGKLSEVVRQLREEKKTK